VRTVMPFAVLSGAFARADSAEEEREGGRVQLQNPTRRGAHNRGKAWILDLKWGHNFIYLIQQALQNNQGDD
jgi:hypothetical protein